MKKVMVFYDNDNNLIGLTDNKTVGESYISCKNKKDIYYKKVNLTNMDTLEYNDKYIEMNPIYTAIKNEMNIVYVPMTHNDQLDMYYYILDLIPTITNLLEISPMDIFNDKVKDNMISLGCEYIDNNKDDLFDILSDSRSSVCIDNINILFSMGLLNGRI